MNYRDKKNAGFSMIEVLVASTILVVMVMMLAMLFQQTGMAWRTGVRRADASMQVRSMIGAIQRDAAKAVDERSIPPLIRDLLGGGQDFSSSALAFYTLSANGFKDDVIGNTARRSISFVEYDASGQRTETFLLATGIAELPISSNVRDFLLSSSDNKPDLGEVHFDIQDDPLAPPESLPLSIRLDVDVTSQGYTLEVGAASAGPDRVWKTDDDIRTWAE